MKKIWAFLLVSSIIPVCKNREVYSRLRKSIEKLKEEYTGLLNDLSKTEIGAESKIKPFFLFPFGNKSEVDIAHSIKNLQNNFSVSGKNFSRGFCRGPDRRNQLYF